MLIKDVELGSKIFHIKNLYTGHTIIKVLPSVLLGWKNYYECEFFGVFSLHGIDFNINDDRSIFDHINDFKYGRWVDGNALCNVLEPYTKHIENRNQVCIDCLKPAPHTKSNFAEDKYICSLCKVLRDL